MAGIKSIYSEFFLGGAAQAYRFSSQSNSMNINLASEKLEDTRFQSTSRTFLQGDTESSIEIAGYFDDIGAGFLEQEIAEMIANSESLYVAGLLGTAAGMGCPGYVLDGAEVQDFQVSAPVAGLITVNGTFSSNSGAYRGMRVYQSTISSTGTSAYIDLGATAPGAAGGVSWLWVTAKTGTITNATIVLQSDDNTGFSTPATECTFTFSALGGYRQALTGTIDRYLRLSTTSLGGATNFTVLVVAAVSGVTY